MKIIIFLLLLINSSKIYTQSIDPIVNSNSAPSTTSKQIPNLTVYGSLLDKLNNTVWVASDFKRGENLFVFFRNNAQGVASALQGQPVGYPQQTWPMKFIQEGQEPHSGIFIVTSNNKILYYLFRLITPYYLGISAGYESIEPLTQLQINNYFENGYILQLVY